MVKQLESLHFDSFEEILRKYKYTNMLVNLKSGTALEVSQPTGLHGETMTLLSMKMANFVYGNRLGRVTIRTGFRLKRYGTEEDTIFGLDIAFFRKEKTLKPFKNQIVKIVPDLAVEVIASGESEMALRTKQLSLISAGTSLFWTVYPTTKVVVVWAGNQGKMLKIDTTLTGGDVLPGFELPVREIFAE